MFNFPCVCVRVGVCAPVPYRLLNGLYSTDDYIKTFLLLLRMTNTPLKGYTKLLQSVPYWWTFQVFLILYICQFLFLLFLLHRFLDVGLLCCKKCAGLHYLASPHKLMLPNLWLFANLWVRHGFLYSVF